MQEVLMDRLKTPDHSRFEIQTFRGHFINPLDPDPAKLDVEDIAHALSNMCRYTGHVRKFYSVAQHACLVAQYAPEPFKLQALMHDASEAYLADIARPVKAQPEFGDVYKRIENRLMYTIAAKFGFPWPESVVVQAIDRAMLSREIEALMTHQTYEPSPEIDPITEFWPPEIAEQRFLLRYLLHRNDR